MAQESESAQVYTPPEAINREQPALFSPERPSYKWWVTLALMLGILTQGLNFGTVNVALPSMMTSLQAEVNTIHWVITAFMVTRTVVMPMVGWIAAVVGRDAAEAAALELDVADVERGEASDHRRQLRAGGRDQRPPAR